MTFLELPLILWILAVFAFVIFIGLVVFLVVFWIMMLVDAVSRNFKSGAEKIAWVLIIIFLHILGAAIYYFVVKRK